MEELKVFKNKELGKLRAIVIDGVPYFVAKNVLEILECYNPQEALKNYVNEEDKITNDLFTVNGTKDILINESGLYSLILLSKVKSVIKAREINRWITLEVLPSIRANQQPKVKQPSFEEITNAINKLANSLRANDETRIAMYSNLFKAYNIPTTVLPSYIDISRKEAQ